MKDYVFDKIRTLGFYGVMHYGEEHRFNDDIFNTKDNLYKYRISKIQIFLGEKDLIYGLQTFFKNSKGEEIAGARGFDINIINLKKLIIKTLEIKPNDFLCKLNVWVGDDYITKLRFCTKKGKELIVGNDDGEDKIISVLNDNKDHIILSLFGAYRNYLDIISCKYMPLIDYLEPLQGYIELKKKLKYEDFKRKTLEKS